MLTIRGLRTPIIGPIDLDLQAGDIVVLRGASGAGKSLLLRAIVDLDPNDGAVDLRGRDRRDFAAPDWRRRVAFVPAESGWWADRVRDHFQPEPDPSPDLAALGLPDAMNWEISRLSTGEKQRLALVRALQMQPDVLLLDEPTSALDAQSVSLVEQVIRDQAGQGRAVLLVSHDDAQGQRLGDSFYRLANGRLAVET